MNRWSLKTNQLVEVHQDFGDITYHFRRICGMYLKLLKRKNGRSQHVTGWTWEHKDFDELCSKISLDTDHMATCRTLESWRCQYPKNFTKPTYTEEILICLWTSLIWGVSLAVLPNVIRNSNKFRFHKHRIHLSVIWFKRHPTTYSSVSLLTGKINK